MKYSLKWMTEIQVEITLIHWNFFFVCVIIFILFLENCGPVTSSDWSVLWEHGDWDHVHGLRAGAGDCSTEGQLQQSWQSGGIPSDGEHLPYLHLCFPADTFHFDLALFSTLLSHWQWHLPSGKMRSKFWQRWCVIENTEGISNHLHHFFAFIFCWLIWICL